MGNATVHHAFTSAIADDATAAAAGEVLPSHWNAAHTIAAGGSDTEVQFNDGGALAGDAGLVYSKSLDKLTTTTFAAGLASTTTGAVTLAHASSAHLTTVQASNAGAARTITLPDATGTVALTSQLTDGSVTRTEVTAVPADLGYSGITTTLTYGESLAPGNAVYLKSDGTVCKADANGTGTYPAIGIALETASSGSHLVLLHGIYRDDSAFNWTVGGVVYLSATAGSLTQTQPSATDDVIQVIGVATHADRLYVRPSLDYMTHT